MRGPRSPAFSGGGQGVGNRAQPMEQPHGAPPPAVAVEHVPQTASMRSRSASVIPAAIRKTSSGMSHPSTQPATLDPDPVQISRYSVFSGVRTDDTVSIADRGGMKSGLRTCSTSRRARFEEHPENKGTQYEVLRGLLGRELNCSASANALPVIANRLGTHVTFRASVVLGRTQVGIFPSGGKRGKQAGRLPPPPLFSRTA